MTSDHSGRENALPEPTPALAVDGRAVAGLQGPLISFIVVNWNYAHFIDQTLASIASQDYPHFECVIVDNGSTDNSLEVIARFVDADDRFKLVRLAQNSGQLGGAFAGLRVASGAFVALIDADDVLFPTFASTHLQVHLSLVDTAALTSSNVIEVNAHNHALSSSCWRELKRPAGGHADMREERLVARLPQISTDFYRSVLMQHVSRAPRETAQWMWSPGTSNVMRRSIADLFVNDRRPAAMIPSDSYFLKLCHVFGGSAFIDLPLSTRRVHGSNYFASMEEISGVRNVSRSFAEGLKAFDVDLENLRGILFNASLNYWTLGSYFWTCLDNVTLRQGYGRRRYYNTPRVVDLFLEHAKELHAACGTSVFLWAIGSRFSFTNARKIVGAAFDGRVPPAFMFWWAVPIRFPPRGVWRKLVDWWR